MDVKKKLVELIGKVQDEGVDYAECFGDGDRPAYVENDVLADHLIANGVTVQEWIPVTEMLPDTEDRVLVCCKTKKGLQTVNMAYLFNGTWHGQGSMSGVTHWMPLPVPPKGE